MRFSLGSDLDVFYNVLMQKVRDGRGRVPNEGDGAPFERPIFRGGRGDATDPSTGALLSGWCILNHDVVFSFGR